MVEAIVWGREGDTFMLYAAAYLSASISKLQSYLWYYILMIWSCQSNVYVSPQVLRVPAGTEGRAGSQIPTDCSFAAR